MTRSWCLVLILLAGQLLATAQQIPPADPISPPARYRVISGPSGKALAQRLNAEGANGYRVIATTSETLQGTARTLILEYTPGSKFEYEVLTGRFDEIEHELNRVGTLGFRYVPATFSLLSFVEGSTAQKILFGAADLPATVSRLNICVVERANNDSSKREYRFLRRSGGLEDIKPDKIPADFELAGLLDAGFAIFERAPASKPPAYRFIAVGKDYNADTRRNQDGTEDPSTDMPTKNSALAAASAQGFRSILGAPRSKSWGAGQAYYLLAMAQSSTAVPEPSVRFIGHSDQIATVLDGLAAQGRALDGPSSGIVGIYQKGKLLLPSIRQKFAAVTQPLPPGQKARYRVFHDRDVAALGLFLDDPKREYRLVFFGNLDDSYLAITEAREGQIQQLSSPSPEKQP